MLLLKGDHDQAVADLTEAIRLSPENPGPRAHFLVSRALAHAEKGDHDKAIADDTEVIRLNSAAKPPYLGAYGGRAEPYRNRAGSTCGRASSTRRWPTRPRRSASIRRTRRHSSSADMPTGRRARRTRPRLISPRPFGSTRRGGEPELAYLIPFLDEVKSFLLFCNLPVYGLLGDWGLREDLGLSPAQERRLREVGAKFKAEHAKIEDGLSKLPEKEQDAKRDEVYSWENLQKTREPLRKEIEGILTPSSSRPSRSARSLRRSFPCLRTPPRLRSGSAPTGSRQRSCGGSAMRSIAAWDGKRSSRTRNCWRRSTPGNGRCFAPRSSANSAGAALGVGESLNSGTGVGTGSGTLTGTFTLAGSGVVTISGGTLAGGAGGETKTSTGTASTAAGPSADAGEPAEGGNMCLDVYALLLERPVRDRLGMSKAQQQKLLEIATKCQADQEAAGAVVRSAEKTTVLDMCYSEYDARTRAVAKQIEALLTPRRWRP